MRNAAFGRRIGRHEPAAEEAQHRCDIDDAAAVFRQPVERCLADAHRAVQVDVDHGLEDVRITLLPPADDAGTIDDDVEIFKGPDESPDGIVGPDIQNLVADRT